MNRLSIATALSAALLLGACASEPPLMSDKRAATPPGGVWKITDAVAVDAPAAGQAPYLGQHVELYTEFAGDPAGRLCRAPVYQGYEAPPSLVLGVKGEDAPGPVLEVTCEGEAFGTYVRGPDGGLRTRVNAWLLTLDRAPAAMGPPERMVPPPPSPALAPQPPAPAPEPVAAPPLPPPPLSPPPVAAPAPGAKPAAGPLVYLASYRTTEGARAGFERLVPHSAILGKSTMVLKEVDLGAKGRWVRLFAQAPDAARGTALCGQLGKRLPGCGVGWAK